MPTYLWAFEHVYLEYCKNTDMYNVGACVHACLTSMSEQSAR